MTKLDHASVCRPNVVALAICAALGGLSSSASAEPMQQVPFYRNSDTSRWSDNYVEIGAGYLSTDTNTPKAFKFGEWTGLNDEGGYGTLGFNYLTRSQTDDAVNLRIYGQNLGLDTFKFLMEGGKQGAISLSFGADRLTRSELDSAKFIYDGLGTNNLTLPAGYAGTTSNVTTPANSALITANLKPFEISQQRDIYRIGLSAVVASNWDFKVNVREDKRDGNRLSGALQGFGNATIIPYAIDDKTQQVETVLAYTTKPLQLQLAYNYSKYENDQTATRWQQPFQPAAGATTAQLSQMPSNEMHQVSFTGALKLAKSTRLTTLLSQSIATQNETFLPYTSNPAIASSPVGTDLTNIAALPRSSLDGKIITSIADLALTTRPLEKMNLKLAYQFRDSDNRTPTAEYRYVVADGVAQQAENLAAGVRVRTNVPLSSKENKYTLDTDYEIFSRTLLRAVFERRDIDYFGADVNSATEDKGSLELRRAISDEFTGAIGYTRKERRGDNYNKNQYFVKSYTGSGLTTNYTNNPQMRQFLYGDLDEDRVRINGNWIASESVSIQGSVDLYDQKNQGMNCSDVEKDAKVAAAAQAWTAECIGRKGVEGTTASVDGQWQPTEDLNTFLFYTYATYEVDQLNRNWTNNGNSDETLRDSTVKSEFVDHTIGTGLNWMLTQKLSLGGQYVYTESKGKTSVQLVPGSTIQGTGAGQFQPTNLPDNKVKMHTVQLYGKYNYSSRLALRLNYMFEQLRQTDWSYDNIGATSVNGVLLAGQAVPRYDSHYIGASVALSTW